MIALAAFLGGSIGVSVFAADAVMRAIVRLRDRVAARFAIPPWQRRS